MPVKPWNKTFDASQDGPMCIQSFPGYNKSDISEDCLRINVYTKDLNPTKLKPVIFYIHGGAFRLRSGQSNLETGPEYLMDKEIVLVSFNHRLGILGFLSTGTADVPGNNGLKDQVIAMRWTRDHITKFGGDPNSVTLLGHSSGGRSITLLLLSPMTKGLFHRVVIMSGSSIAQWEIPNNQTDIAKKQASLLNCKNDTIENVMKCLRSVC